MVVLYRFQESIQYSQGGSQETDDHILLRFFIVIVREKCGYLFLGSHPHSYSYYSCYSTYHLNYLELEVHTTHLSKEVDYLFVSESRMADFPGANIGRYFLENRRHRGTVNRNKVWNNSAVKMRICSFQFFG